MCGGCVCVCVWRVGACVVGACVVGACVEVCVEGVCGVCVWCVCVWCVWRAEAAPPVRLWPDHFSSRPDYNIMCSVVTHNLRLTLYADSAMTSVSRPSCGPTIETPQQPRSFLSQNGHFDATRVLPHH